MMIQKNRLKPELVFLFLGLVFGVTFLMITPPFQVPDEPDHFLKAVQVSEGKIISDQSILFVSLYSPVPYILPALVIMLGKILNLSSFIIFYLGRFTNILFYILIIYAAVRFTPVLKWPFVLLALMPMSLYEAVSYSIDGFTIAISFLLISFIFKLSFDDEIKHINSKHVLFIAFLGVLLVLSKQIYVLLLLLFFIIPASKFVNGKNRIKNFLIILLPSFAVYAGWSYLVNNLYMPISTQVSPYQQLGYMVYHPINFITIFFNTIIQQFNYYLTTFVGSFGWVDVGLDTPLPIILVYIYLVVLISSVLFEGTEYVVKKNQKLISGFIFLIILGFIFIMEYLLWTVVGNSRIDGVFGRYIIPFAPLILIIFSNKNLKVLKWKNYIIIIFILIVLSISTILIFNRFYG